MSIRFSIHNSTKNPKFQKWDDVVELKSIPDIEMVFKTLTHSPVIFKDNERENDTILEACGVIVDIDEGCRIEEFQSQWKDFVFCLYPSKSHQKPKYKEDGTLRSPAQDRFHVFFPFEKSIKFETTEDRETYKLVLGNFIKGIEYADQQVKDPARLVYPNPSESWFSSWSDGKKNLNIETMIELGVQHQKRDITNTDNYKVVDGDEIGTGDEGNSFTLEQLVGCMDILKNNQDYNLYQRITAWAKSQSQFVQKLVSEKLAQNPNYKDTPESIQKKIDTYSIDSPIQFRNLVVEAKKMNPSFLLPSAATIKIDKYFDTKIVFAKEPDTFFFDICKFNLQTNSYWLKLRKGWKDVGKFADLDNYFVGYNVHYEEKTKKGEIVQKNEPVHKYYIKKKGLVARAFDVVQDPTSTNQDNINLTPYKTNIRPVNHGVYGEELVAPFVKMVFESLCNEDKVAYEYLMRWFAWVVDYKKTGVEVQIKGDEGTGKSTLATIMQRLMTRQAVLSVDNVDQITGDYNESLKGVFFLVLEEAIFSGSQVQRNRLKNLITGDTILVNPKFERKLVLKNNLNILSVSNEDIIHKIGLNDRRTFVLQTSNKYNAFNGLQRNRANIELFDKLYSNMEKPEFYEHLLSIFYDLSKETSLNFIKNIPTTQAKIEVIKNSMNSFDTFISELLENGGFFEIESTPGRYSSFCIFSDDFFGADLYKAYLSGADKGRYSNTLSKHAFLKKFKDLTGSDQKTKRVGDSTAKGFDPVDRTKLKQELIYNLDNVVMFEKKEQKKETQPEPKPEPEPKKEIETKTLTDYKEEAKAKKESRTKKKEPLTLTFDEMKAKRMQIIQRKVNDGTMSREACQVSLDIDNIKLSVDDFLNAVINFDQIPRGL